MGGKQDTATSRIAPGLRTTASILQVLRKKTPLLKQVYDSHLQYERFGGKVVLRFAIRPDGRIAYLLPIEDTTKLPRFVRDILNRVQDWKFAPVEDENLDIVTVPFTFSE